MKKREKLIGVRLDPETFEELDLFSNRSKSTKMEIIRLAIESYLDEMRDSFDDAAVEAFINLRTTEEEYLENFELKKVPKTSRKQERTPWKE